LDCSEALKTTTTSFCAVAVILLSAVSIHAPPELNDQAGHVALTLENDLYGAGASFTSVGEHFSPALGFVRRRDMRRYVGERQYRPTVNMSALPIRRLNFSGDASYIEGQDGDKQSVAGELAVQLEAFARDNVAVEGGRSFERLTESFEIRPGAVIPIGDYTANRVELGGSTDQSRRVFGSLGGGFGGFFHGTRTDIGGSLGFRQSRHLSLEGRIDYSIIDLPIDNGEFDATTASMSILAALNRKLFAKALIQYDNFTRNVQANIRIDWIHTPGSDLFLVFNTSYHLAEDGNDALFDPHQNVILNSQAAIAKLTYLILL